MATILWNYAIMCAKRTNSEQFMVRLPDGMRERIAVSAERNGRSMNAEIVQALEQYFPPEPSIEEVIERVQNAIEMAKSVNAMPYRKVLIESLDQLSDRLASGLEPDQFQSRTAPAYAAHLDEAVARIKRWRRAQQHGVELDDLQREIDRGLFNGAGRDKIGNALMWLRSGEPERALRNFRLERIKFAEPEASIKAIEENLREIYKKNWGNPDLAGEEDPF